MNEENKKINKKKVIALAIIIAIIILLIVIIIVRTRARYRSAGESSLDTAIAFFAVKDEYQTGNIFISDIYPREEPFDYKFTVTNTDGINVAETNIEYTVELEITTNLPLQFTIYKNDVELVGNDQIENTVGLDSKGQSYIRRIKIKNGSFTYDKQELDAYKISAKFPLEYAEQEEFESMIDNINIILNAKQKID